MFIEVTRAYKTLTDPTARKNWIEYGNPDGPQVRCLSACDAIVLSAFR